MVGEQQRWQRKFISRPTYEIRHKKEPSRQKFEERLICQTDWPVSICQIRPNRWPGNLIRKHVRKSSGSLSDWEESIAQSS